MFGLGMQEIILLALVGALIVVPVVIIVLNQSRRSPRVAELEEENRRLRAELDEKRDRPA
jgi:hypothetical protein